MNRKTETEKLDKPVHFNASISLIDAKNTVLEKIKKVNPGFKQAELYRGILTNANLKAFAKDYITKYKEEKKTKRAAKQK